jgi:hypothetical protein
MLSMQGQISLIFIWHRILIGHRMMRQRSTMHQAALIPSGAYLIHVKNQRTWSVVIAAMNVQPLERAVPHWKSAVIVDQRAGARCVVVVAAAACRQVDLAGSRV